MINRAFFFASVRATLFGGKIKQLQVDGLNLKLAYPCPDDRQRAYVLATSYVETDRTMLPIYERGARSYFDKYEPGTKLGKQLGNTQKGDGYLFRGRGDVQVTGRRNYRIMSDVVGIDLEADPDIALIPAHSCAILYEGMQQGRFTGRALGEYIDYDRTDWKNARRVVNGTDRAAEIAGYAQRFHAAITYTA